LSPRRMLCRQLVFDFFDVERCRAQRQERRRQRQALQREYALHKALRTKKRMAQAKSIADVTTVTKAAEIRSEKREIA
jgi:hypothetical protein